LDAKNIIESKVHHIDGYAQEHSQEIEGRELSNFQGELKQAARVRIRHLAQKFNKYWSLIDDKDESQ